MYSRTFDQGMNGANPPREKGTDMSKNGTRDQPLWQWNAYSLSTAIADKEVSCADAMGSTVERMRATNGQINAVVDDLSEAALRQAAEHDRILAERGPLGPLHGVPVTIKENVDQTGRATPNGVTAFKEIIAPPTPLWCAT